MYSFITPRKKYSIDTFSTMWLGFILFISLLMIFFGFYLDRKNRFFEQDLNEIKNKILFVTNEKKEVQKEIDNIIQIHKNIKSTYNTNASIRQGLINFFSLISDQIKINKLYMTKYELKIYGKTDSPKTYKLLLEPPLKSIFDSSKVGFTKENNTSYLFSSYNTIKRVEHEK